MSVMESKQRGGVLVLVLVVISLVAIAAIIFGILTYSKEQDYKNNVDSKVAAAVSAAKTQQTAADQQQFTLESEKTFTTYQGPQQFGSINLPYPKGWSGYVDTTGSSNLVDGYFNPGVVPAIEDQTNNFALRLQVIDSSYATELANFTSEQSNGGVNLSINPYSLPKVPNVTGVMIQGQIEQNKQGILVMLPLRTQTLEIWTEASQYYSLLTQNILPAASFSP